LEDIPEGLVFDPTVPGVRGPAQPG
jgi:hypothetical protein